MSKTLHYMTLLKERLERTLSYNLEQLDLLPEGTLVTKKSKGHHYLYWVHASEEAPGTRKSTRLKEADRPLVNKLRRQRIMRLQISRLRHNIKVITRFLKSYRPWDESSCLRELSPAYNENLSYQGFDPPSKNTSHPETLVHRNSVGEVYRSRIEAQISEILRSKGLQYDYDTLLKLETQTWSPDFRITHPETGEFIYLEYFGKMTEDDYAQHNLEKIQDYLRSGYVYGKNLMFIFENTSGIDLEAISRTIDMLIQ